MQTRRLSKDKLWTVEPSWSWPTQINFRNGTSTNDGEQMYQIILKSIYKCRSYGPDRINSDGQRNAHTHVLTLGWTYTHQTVIVITMSCSPQSGSTIKWFVTINQHLLSSTKQTQVLTTMRKMVFENIVNKRAKMALDHSPEFLRWQ